jgi:DNA polymerase II large subunit
MTPSILNYNDFVKSLENGPNVLQLVEKSGQLAQVSRLKNSSRASILSEKSTTSINSQSSSKTILPSALDPRTSINQKGFDLRQFDNSKDFDNVLTSGFSSNNNNDKELFTLKFTLTPELLR